MITYLRWIFGLILLFLSFSGYVFGILRNTKIKVEFSPFVVCSTVGLLEFTAGLLNVLPEAAIIICGIGVFCFVIEIRKSGFQKKCITPGIVFFVVSLLLILVLAKEIFFVGWDNFSHWALVVKQMLKWNRFPNFQNTIIIFQSYPTGSASFIYYVCFFMGDSEGIMFFAQNILQISGMTCIWAYVKQKDIVARAMAIGLTAFVLFFNTPVNGLMVDNLIVIMGLAGITILYYYKDNICRGILYVLPGFCLLAVAKTGSGILFVIAGWIFIIITERKQIKKSFYAIAAFIIMPLCYTWLWKKHVSMVFANGNNTLHSMSVSNYKNVFAERTLEDIKNIIVLYLKEIVSVRNPMWYFFVFILLLLIYCRKNIDLFLKLKKYMYFIIVVYILWDASLLGIYLMSMPLAEAYQLASYDRYHNTIIIYIIGLFGVFCLSLQGEQDSIFHFRKRDFHKTKSCLVIGMIIFLLIIDGVSVIKTISYNNDTSKKIIALEESIENSELINGKNYIIYTEDADNGYYMFYGRYRFDTEEVASVNKETWNSFNEWGNYNYILMIDHNEELEDYLKKNTSLIVVENQ